MFRKAKIAIFFQIRSIIIMLEQEAHKFQSLNQWVFRFDYMFDVWIFCLQSKQVQLVKYLVYCEVLLK